MRRASDLLDDAARAVSIPPHIQARLRFEARRKAFHVFGAIVAVPALLLLPLGIAVGLALLGIVLVVVANLVVERRLPRIEPMHSALVEPIERAIETTRRSGERYPWSPVLFLASLVVCGVGTALLGLPKAYAFAAYGILGVGDAASAIVGVAYGRTRLPWNRRKSVEGTTAGLLGAFAAAVVFATVDFAWRGVAIPLPFLPVAFVGAAVGALLETLPGVQDNLAVPVGSWAVMVGLGLALGVA